MSEVPVTYACGHKGMRKVPDHINAVLVADLMEVIGVCEKCYQEGKKNNTIPVRILMVEHRDHTQMCVYGVPYDPKFDAAHQPANRTMKAHFYKFGYVKEAPVGKCWNKVVWPKYKHSECEFLKAAYPNAQWAVMEV